jgi:hypothetical protein
MCGYRSRKGGGSEIRYQAWVAFFHPTIFSSEAWTWALGNRLDWACGRQGIWDVGGVFRDGGDQEPSV